MSFIEDYNELLKKAPTSEQLQQLYAGAYSVIDNNLDAIFKGVEMDKYTFNEIGLRFGRPTLEATCGTAFFPHEVPLIVVCEVADAIEKTLNKD